MGVSTSFPLGNVPLVVALPKGVEKAQVYVVATVVRAAGNGWLRVADLLSTTNETVALHREQVTLLPNELLVWTSPRGGLLEFAFHMKDEKLWANRTLTIRPALPANHLFPPTAVKLSGANLPEIIRASGFGDIFKSIGRADPAVQLSVFSTMYWTNLARSRSLSEVSVGRALEALAVVNRTWNEDVPAQVQQGGSPGPYLTTMAQWTQHVAVPSAAVQWLTSSNSSFSPAVLTSPSALAPLANGLSASASKKLSTSSTNLALNLFTLPPTDVDGDLPKTRRGWLGFRAEVKRVDVPHYADFMLKAQPLRSTVHRYFTSQDVTRRVLIAEERLELLVAQSSANRNIGDVAVRAVLPVLDELVPMAQELFAATRQQFEGAVLAFMPFIQAYVRDAKFVQSANLKVCGSGAQCSRTCACTHCTHTHTHNHSHTHTQVLSENFHYLKDFTARQEIYQESRGSKNLRPIDVATLIGGDALTPLIESLSLRDTNGTQVNSVTATSNTILSNTFLEWFAGLDDAAAASMGTSKDGDTDEAMSVCRVDSSLCADMPAVRQDLVTLNRILLERELSAITALSATPRHFPFEVDTTSRYRTGMYARPSNFTIAVERMAAKQVNRDNWMTLVCLDFLRLSTAEQLREDGGEIKTSLLSEYAGMVVPSSSSTSFDNAATTNDWTLLMLRASNLGYFLNQRSTNDTYLSARTMRILRLFSTLLRADPTTGRPLYVTDPHWLAEAVAQLLAVN